MDDGLASLSKWLDNNLMKVNVTKTEVMLQGASAKTGKTNHVNVVMNNHAVTTVHTV